MPLPGWFAEEGWSLTPETSGMSGLMGRAPHLGPITAMVRRRSGAARLLIGGRNLAGPNDPAAHFRVSIDGVPFQEWDAPPGFFLKIFDIPAGRLAGQGTLGGARRGNRRRTAIPTAIEQFDVQDEQSTMWGYDQGWQEAEYSMALGVWRWTSDRATLRIAGPPRAVRITLTIESPLRYFDGRPMVRARAGEREMAASAIADSGEWTFEVPADALPASGGAITIETDKTFVPAERGSAPDRRRLGLRVFAIRVSNGLTPAETYPLICLHNFSPSGNRGATDNERVSTDGCDSRVLPDVGSCCGGLRKEGARGGAAAAADAGRSDHAAGAARAARRRRRRPRRRARCPKTRSSRRSHWRS